MRCPMCRGAIIPAGSGRPPRWCSDTCRYRAHNRLRTLRRKLAEAQDADAPRRAAYLSDWIDRLEVTDARTP